MVIGQNGIEVERSTQAVIFQFILDYVWVLWLIVGLIMLVYRMASYRNFKKVCYFRRSFY
ncbi:peptidase M56 domain-containing protein [Listeria fleischmannii FSL S10-1203]|uniref:Peptidase M56 domain-containing protein n=1 Tax=Listeria fleischmannii FSL S10-1203 TaxID=1265822 RepID=W7D749_9LIST|nr:peptidase M56 domain-containing protein [Listeria fleischmannii FSL S10-1203]